MLAADELSVGLSGPTGEIFDAAYFDPIGGSVALPAGPFMPPPDDLEGQLEPLMGNSCEAFRLSCSVEDQLSTPVSIGVDDFGFGDDSKVDQVVALPEPAGILPIAISIVALGRVSRSRLENTKFAGPARPRR